MQGPSLRQPLDRDDFASVGLYREHQTRLHESSVHEHRTGAALAHHTAHMGAGQPDVVPQKVHQERSRLHVALAGFPVDGQRDRMLHHNTPKLVRRMPGGNGMCSNWMNNP